MKKSVLKIIICLLVLSCGLSAQSYIGAGNSDGITISTSDGAATAENTLNGSGLDAPLMEASRFLTQAAMGHDIGEVRRTAAMGLEEWMDEQFGIQPNYLTPQMEANWEEIYGWNIDYYTEKYQEENPGAPITDEVLEEFEEDIFGPWAVDFHYAWWQNTLLEKDQLRQKTAYALSQILVISTSSALVDHAESFTSYYDILTRHAFGNFRDLLYDVTMSPSMGLYLSHYNNPKEIPAENLHPDENYAREIMQLFSIGLYELNNDGSRKKDANGNDIPTYGNKDIKELAKVFTGLGAGGVMPNPWVDDPFFGMDWYLADKAVPMIMYDEFHETREKSLLGQETIPAGQTGMEDLNQALDFLFNHANVGPFLSRQLIQRFVKSNPTPGYIDRVATVFNDNGSGVRGDLKAVMKAILMDDEARSCAAFSEDTNGKLLEPLLRSTHLAKAFPLVCNKDTLYVVNGDTLDQTRCNDMRYWLNGFDRKNLLRQAPLGAPSVFNFYLPEHQPVGEFATQGLYAPEYKIHDSSTAINYVNILHSSLLWNYLGGSWESEINPDLGWLALDTDAIISLASEPESLYNYLDVLFTRGQLTDKTRNILREFVDEQPDWVDDYRKMRGTMMLLLMAPDYTILK